jgi:DNA replication licensing factor MCM4
MWVPNEGGRVSHPTICANQNCMSKFTMTLAHAQSLFSDKQLIKIQESPNMIPEGETPHAVTAFVYDALVDFVRPGDRVTIVGALRIPYFRPMSGVPPGWLVDRLEVK